MAQRRNIRSHRKAHRDLEPDFQAGGDDPHIDQVYLQLIASGRHTTLVVVCSLILDLLGFTMILPLFPSIMEHYRVNDDGLYAVCLLRLKYVQTYLGIPDESSSVLFGGILGSMFSLLQFMVSPIIGALSDVYGRKPVMLLCLVGMATSYLLWGMSYYFIIFVLARFIGGLSKGNVSLSLAILSDVLDQRERGWGMALVGLSFSVGFIVGPMIGAVFTVWPNRDPAGSWFVIPASFALGLGILNILFVAYMMKETLPQERRATSVAQSMSEAISYINIRDLFNFKAVASQLPQDVKDLQKLGFVYFLYIFVYSGLEFTVTFLTHTFFKFTSMNQGMLFFAVGMMMAVVQGGYVRRIPPQKIPDASLWGLALIIPGYFLVGCSPIFESTIPLWSGLTLYALSTALVIPTMNTMVSEFGSYDQKGSVMGIFRALGALARALGPVVFCFIYWFSGPVTTYFSGAMFLFLPLVMMRNLLKSAAERVAAQRQQ